MLLQIRSHDLHRILSEASLFAHPLPNLPAINAVHLICDKTSLAAIATDRFKMAVTRLPLTDFSEGEVTPFKTTIPLEQVKLLAQHLKTPKGFQHIRYVKLDLDDSDGAVVSEGLAPAIFNVTASSGAELTFRIKPVTDHPFPQWKHLLKPSDEDGQMVGCITLSPDHMEPFFKVAKAGNHGQLRFTFRGSTKPVVVHMGENFAGLVMPYRPDSGDVGWPHPEWLQNLLGGKVASPNEAVTK